VSPSKKIGNHKLRRTASTLLHIRPMMHYGGPSEELERSMECRRVLLEADADPMVGPMSEISGISMSHFGSLLDIGTVVGTHSEISSHC